MIQAQEIINLLKLVDQGNLWGMAIAKVMQIEGNEKVIDLIIQLRSQSRDNGQMMKEILGDDLFRLINSI